LLNERDRKGCMLVNAALDRTPNDPAFRKVVAKALVGIEGFFQTCVRAGQADGTIARSLPAETLAQNLLSVLMGIRVLARVRPERTLLERGGGGASASPHCAWRSPNLRRFS
jgi:TetR/AcrR family transcriptional regulator, transcriptional repressor for nem operon